MRDLRTRKEIMRKILEMESERTLCCAEMYVVHVY